MAQDFGNPQTQAAYQAYLRQQGQQELADLAQQTNSSVNGAIDSSSPQVDTAGMDSANAQTELQKSLATLQTVMGQQNSQQGQGDATMGDSGSAYDPSLLGQSIGGKMLSQAGPITETPGEYQPGVEVFSHGMTNGLGVGVPTGTKAAVPQGQWQVVQSFAGAHNGYIGDGENSGYGNSVLVRNAQTGEMLRYSHLSKVGVQPGQVLKGGQVLGATGATGNVTGPHLNLEYYTPQGTIGNVLKSPYAQSLGLNRGKK